MQGLSYQQMVREGYLELAKEQDRIKIIDASQPVDAIYQEIRKQIWDLIR